MLTQADLHWSAGALDAKGSFTISAGAYHRPMIRFGHKKGELVERLKSLYGGTVYFYDASTWEWMVRGHRAIGVSLTLYSLLSSYRQREIARMVEVYRSTTTRPYVFNPTTKRWS